MRARLLHLLAALSWVVAAPAAASEPEREGEAAPQGEAAPEPEADREAQARALFERGLEYSRQERWGEALEYFRRSRARLDRASSAFNMAVAQLRLGRPSGALRSLDDYLRLADPTDEREARRREEARRLLELALASIARVELTLDPAHAQLELDGIPHAGEGARRELTLDPGPHRLEASADGYHRGVLELSVLDGERSSQRLALEPIPAPPAVTAGPAARPARDGSLVKEPLFWAVTGTLLAAVTVGLVVGLSDGADPGTGGSTGVVLEALRAQRRR